MPSFIQFKNTIRQMHADFGQPISAREAHSIARSAWISQLAEQFARAAEAYAGISQDPTGEDATDNVLIEYLTRYGSLRAPTSAAAIEEECAPCM